MEFAPSNSSSPFDEITDFLASAPTLQEIIVFKPSDALDQRLHELLEKNSRDALTPDERMELDEFLHVNHLLKMLRLKARKRLSGT